ncbi:GGDEF domain-containing protein [Pseudoalteromonas sp. L23]|uniref:GGDEF domain-containing protein n=1 Tax=unclassified Pseudoalteromonas TaxID=194690 RepID=UPI001EF0A55B|nr:MULTISPECIES: GGDEF domain-containing protein [unclassified Pseudoalteromonas]MCF7516501.1 GGDEF domain-containing protein [Pseudoalteromonas sp. L7]MCF7528557.1 GGDEF domain-containing protein [Pseudoalteromonas sp. L23]MCX2769705.1 GGDEF domain-containing protein [Pseudoalteromonas sp. B530]
MKELPSDIPLLKGCTIVIIGSNHQSFHLLEAEIYQLGRVHRFTNHLWAVNFMKKHHPDVIIVRNTSCEITVYRLLQKHFCPLVTPTVLITPKVEKVKGALGWHAGLVDVVSDVVSSKILKQKIVNLLHHKLPPELITPCSYLDDMTGAFNRAVFDKDIDRAILYHRSSNKPISVMLLNFDYFCQFNAAYGYKKGDDTIRICIQSMQMQIRRPYDALYRYDTNTFALVAPNTNKANGRVLANKLLQSLFSSQIEHKNSPEHYVTASIGGVTLDTAIAVSSADELLMSADNALLSAKIAGKNRVAWL